MNRLLALLILLALCSAASAQEWVEHGGAEYNCSALNSILADYGDSVLSKSGDSVMTVSALFEIMFPSCPQATESAEREIPATSGKSAPESLFSFRSDEDGLQPVLGPLTLPAGVYVFTATTDDYITVSPTPLDDGCGFDLKVAIFSISAGDASNGSQSVVVAEANCNVLLEVGNVDEEWKLEIVSSDSLPPLTEADSYYFRSEDAGLQPVLGPIKLNAGIYIFTATTEDYISVSPTSLTGDCGFDLKVAIFSLSQGEAADGAQSVIEVEKDCQVLLDIGNINERWTLEINKLSQPIDERT